MAASAAWSWVLAVFCPATSHDWAPGCAVALLAPAVTLGRTVPSPGTAALGVAVPLALAVPPAAANPSASTVATPTAAQRLRRPLAVTPCSNLAIIGSPPDSLTASMAADSRGRYP